MKIIESSRPWILMTAEAALGRSDRVQKLSDHYDVIIVPAEYFQQAVELLDQLPLKAPNGEQNQDVSPSGLPNVDN